MKRNALMIATLFLFMATAVTAQRPPRPDGPPPGAGGPPRGGDRGGPPPFGREGEPPRGDRDGMGPRNGGQKIDWMKNIDSDKSGSIDRNEIKTAVDTTFADLDRNSDGVIDGNEIRPPRPNGPPPGAGDGDQPGPDGGNKKMLAPFFIKDRIQPGQSYTKAQVEEIVNGVFNEMDKNHDGVISRDESKPPRLDNRPDGPGRMAPAPPNAQFIGAELRFGDKLVKGQAFSAETVIEDNRRLFDGSTVTKQHRGAIYRDGTGRTRREQPLDNVGGINIVGNNAEPQMLVFINDFASRTQYFLDLNNKVARKNPIGDGNGPRPERDGPPEAKTESLGTKTIEGVNCEGTRTTFEIPAGQLGNPNPIQVISEKWFSPELQVVVMSRHLDPLAGEHIFKLVNIKRA